MPVPHPYQIEGADFLASRLSAMLGDEQGLGKTGQTILACAKVGARRVVVICPASVRFIWPEEFSEWWPENPPELRVYSYDEIALTPERRVEIRSFQPDVVVFDEAHYLKNPLAKRTKGCYGRSGVAAYGVYVWSLTGTPAPNNAAELWTHAKVLGGETLGYEEWVETYCQTAPSEYQPYRITGIKRGSLPELRKKIQGWMLRRTVAEVMPQLPELEWGLLPVGGPGVQGTETTARMGAALSALAAKGQWSEAADVMRMYSHKEGTASVRRAIGEAKMPWLLRYVDETIMPGEKLVVFAYHTSVIDTFMKYFEGRAVKIDGSTGLKQRERAVKDFQRPEGGPQFFMGQIGAAGEGITLTAARRVLFLEPDWSPSRMGQAVARVLRIGQNRNVLAQVAYLKGSLDEIVVRTAVRKARAISHFIVREVSQ